MKRSSLPSAPRPDRIGKLRRLCSTPMVPMFLTALLQLGCAYALGPEGHISGAELPYVIPPIALGAGTNQLVAVLGEPTSRRLFEHGEELVWHELMRQRGCRIYLFGFLPLNREPRMVREVVVITHGGHVESAVETLSERSGRSRQRDLLSGAVPRP